MRHIVDKTGKYLGTAGSKTELTDEQVEVTSAPSPDLVKPIWDFDNKRYFEGATEEELLEARKVPQQVPLWAFREVLIDEELFDVAMDKINELPDKIKRKAINFLEYGNYIHRNSPTVEMLGQMVGKSKTEIDTLFINADKIDL